MTMNKTELIASVCHEANRAYCRTLGDFSQPEWHDAPDWQRDSAVKGVAFHIGHLSRGEQPSPSASHESWLAQKREEGWKYGPVKDAGKKEHPCFLPYDQLPVEQRLKDYIFAAIVKAFWDASGSSGEGVAA
jgi:RyR domain